MFTLLDTNDVPVQTVNTNTAAGGAAVITVAADPDQAWCLDFVGGGYHAAPDANSLLTVTFGGTVKYRIPVTSAGALQVPLPYKGLQGAKNQAMVVTLDDGSQIKQLSIQYR